jgi:hypothetical protein
MPPLETGDFTNCEMLHAAFEKQATILIVGRHHNPTTLAP